MTLCPYLKMHRKCHVSESRRPLIKPCLTGGKSRLPSKAGALEIKQKQSLNAFRPFRKPKGELPGGGGGGAGFPRI